MSLTQWSLILRHDLSSLSLIYADLLRFCIMPQIVTSVAKNIKGVVFDEAIIACLSMSLIATFFVPRINNVLDSVPILRDHKSLSSLVAGMVVFGIAKGVRMPSILKAVVIGVAGAFILTAILPLYTQVTNRGVGQ